MEKQRIAQDIPALHKARAWAAKRTEQAKEMAQDRPRNSKARGAPWSDDEPEMLEEFLTFKERLFREEEEKRIRERAIIIQAEDDAKKRREEDAQREVERKAVEEYKNKQQEQEARSAEKKENFRNELERLGLESAQIQVVMESSNLDFQAASGTATVPEVRPSFSPGELSGELETTPSATSGRSRLSLPW